jgi:hypothetical protein
LIGDLLTLYFKLQAEVLRVLLRKLPELYTLSGVIFMQVFDSFSTGLKEGIELRIRVASRLLYTVFGVVFHSIIGLLLVCRL